MSKSELNGPPIRRLYYSSRELSRLTGRDSQELRDWETRFPALRPSKSKTGRRLYRPADREIIRTISDCLNQGQSDENINQILKHPDEQAQPENMMNGKSQWRDTFRVLQKDLKELLQIIDEDCSDNRDSLHFDHDEEHRIP